LGKRSSALTPAVFIANGFEVMEETLKMAPGTASAEHGAGFSSDSASDAAVLEKLCQWFAQHGVAWSGTPGELAANTGCSSDQMVHAIEAASKTLLLSGISGSVCRRPGLPTVICLRLLEEIRERSRDATGEWDESMSSSAEAGKISKAELLAQEIGGEDDPAEKQPLGVAAPESEPLDPEWHRKLVLATLNPADDPADSRRRNFTWKALAVLGLIVAIAITNRSVVLFAGRIGSRVKSLVSRSGSKAKLQSPSVEQKSSPPLHTSAELATLYQKAKADDSEAQYRLGLKLLEGNGVAPDEAAAVAWFERAAEKGQPSAQFELGMAYVLGRGVRQDKVQSSTWLTLAAKNGELRAEQPLRELTPKLGQSEMAHVRWNLAEMYRQGIGTPSDKTAAYIWYILAEASGEKRSAKAKTDLAKSMTEKQVTDATANAFTWLKRHGM
jgi:hypothetical protein